MSWAGRWKGRLRRRRDLLIPPAHTRDYRAWMAARLRQRRIEYSGHIPPGLLSVITAVWDGSPPHYLAALWRGLAAQAKDNAFEWVFVDNGCTRSDLRALLRRMGEPEWTRVVRLDANAGICKGLRAALVAATGRYILPVDADDELYPDALVIVSESIQRSGYPALLYTDEDKVDHGQISEPYFKPDWDPVLLTNSAYCAHLGVMEREKALDLDVYTDSAVEGSVDWDAFLRFAAAGFDATHIREVAYRWRIHPASTAHDDTAKGYVGKSQEAALQRFLEHHPEGNKFDVVPSPLFKGGAHFRLKRRAIQPEPMCLFRPGGAGVERPVDYPSLEMRSLPADARVKHLRNELESVDSTTAFVCLLDGSIKPDDSSWVWEALGVFELFGDAAVVGGRIRDEDGNIVAADLNFGFGDGCGSPNVGRRGTDPGYFGQLWKQRSVSAVSSRWLAVRLSCLREWLPRLDSEMELGWAGSWFGAAAWLAGERVVYSPYLSGTVPSGLNWQVPHEQSERFRAAYPKLIPDHRFYPKPFSLCRGFAIDEAS